MSVLVVAFDGLDHDLVKEHGCENLLGMEEFGGIDNDTGIRYRKTSELFASFITGETYRGHGVTGIRKFRNSRINRFESWARRYRFFKKWNGVRSKLYRILMGCDIRRYPDRSDLKADSFFDEVENSKALSVPSWNPSPFTMEKCTRMAVDSDYGVAELWDTYEYPRRKQQLLEDGSIMYHDLVMAHFQRPDVHQHVKKDEADLEYLYRETDELAGEILDELGQDFETVIFMSDHGVPTRFSHNRNAFYSCNRELFGDETPHITDFYTEIVDAAGR